MCEATKRIETKHYCTTALANITACSSYEAYLVELGVVDALRNMATSLGMHGAGGAPGEIPDTPTKRGHRRRSSNYGTASLGNLQSRVRPLGIRLIRHRLARVLYVNMTD